MPNFLKKRELSVPNDSSQPKYYMALYKCPLCGKVMRYGEPQQIPYDLLPELCGKIVQNQMFIGTVHYSAPMNIPCKCPDGSCGMAAFAGFKVTDPR